VENDKENTGRKKIKWNSIVGYITILFIAASIIRIILCFPAIEYKGKKIRIFTLEPAEKIIHGRDQYGGRDIRGTVLGKHVLKTEYGEIRLRNFCGITAQGHSVYVIEKGYFKNGRAFHNLVVKGIEMPQNIEIVFGSEYKIARLMLDSQEIIVSDIPLIVATFYLRYPDDPAVDIAIVVCYAPEYITLSDTTQIYVDPSRTLVGALLVYKDTEQWVLAKTVVSVKLPGETEFRKYRSITFKKDWGEFIEGELEDGTEVHSEENNDNLPQM
jgi:hypothetical protein